MTGRVAELRDIVQEDSKAVNVANLWLEYDNGRDVWKRDKLELKRYLYATDTTQTTNSSLPWKNKTTLPKLCQIRDNIYANYGSTLFPQRKSVRWEANNEDSNSVNKAEAIENFITWAMAQASFKHEMDKLILDYIDYGNCFATVEWSDERVLLPDSSVKVGYVGPSIRRINPHDIVFNPTAEQFKFTPKIIRSIVSLGEIKDELEKMSNSDNTEMYQELWDYMKDIRENAANFQGDWLERDALYQIEGFGSFRDYLRSNQVEVLTFYGDLYDADNDVFLKNHIVTVVDRHKLLTCKPNPSFFGSAPIFHVPWRKKQDNLWGMGPLDNLVGMQYRLDHVENMKADIFDLVTYPVLQITGMVEDFKWGPGAKIFASEEGRVDMVVPQVQALQANFEIQNLMGMMEEIAGAPKEAMGFRTPGEKTKYEVQRLENAAARVFQNKIKQFEEQLVEPLLNAMLELARRQMSAPLSIKIFDNEFNVASFQALTVEDITGIGRIKPVAARHFAEQADLVQNLTGLAQSPLWPTVQPHISSVKLAKFFETAFNMEDFQMVMPFIALAEQADAQKQAAALQRNVVGNISTPSGIGMDFDMSELESAMAGMEANQLMATPEEQGPVL